MRRFSLASLVAVALITAIPAGASAATQIGETFAPSSCAANSTRLQSVSPGGQYAAPTSGVITRWSFQADGDPPTLKFKVGRPSPGANLTMDADFTIIGESGLVTPSPNILNSYPVQIQVQAGDIIGLYNSTSGGCFRNATGYTYHRRSGDVLPGSTPVTFMPSTDQQLDISAVLEPDCDNDGLGDETQDKVFTNDACPAALKCRGEFLTDVGTAGSDEIVGTANRDVIAALGGKDKVRGLAGRDLICGGKGKDTLRGGKGKDKLLGQGGKDKLVGGGGKDRCIGGKKDDTAKKCEVEKSL